MSNIRVGIIGAGIGGLSAAVDLAGAGCDVTIVERSSSPGGKMRTLDIAGTQIDAGPTVLTLRDVFDGIFSDAGTSLDEHIRLRPLDIIARHAWSGTERLDLFSDVARSADAIGAFSGSAEAKRFLQFSARAKEIFETLDSAFMRVQRPNPISLALAAAPHGLGRLWRISPFTTMWDALGEYFQDPRLRQLFARYATYCGSSPFQAPATLMLVAHAEQKGVWTIDGGMVRLAEAMAQLAIARGAKILYQQEVTGISLSGGCVSGISLSNADHIPLDAVVSNADPAALNGQWFAGLPGRPAVARMPQRSLSAVTWLTTGKVAGFPLTRHNVFFSRDYAGEFDNIFRRGALPGEPTVYVCAQDRLDESASPAQPERLFMLVNAPANGDRGSTDRSEIAALRGRAFERLRQCGMEIEYDESELRTVSPAGFNQLYPATGGALYGGASHGWMASFQRPGARSRISGLYLAGGGVHPGPGLPMAAMSGRLAAQCVISDLVSTRRLHPMAMRGGTSTQSATMASTDSLSSRS